MVDIVGSWQKICGLFKALEGAPQEPPMGATTHYQLSLAAAKYMKPKGDKLTIRKLASRVQFIAFGE